MRNDVAGNEVEAYDPAATLIFGAPPDCADCYPGDTGYITGLP